jgi:lysyl-tRNA synthetase class 1
MATSKGIGAAAHSIAEVVPGEQLRFLFLRPRPNQVIEFDPQGTDAIPRLFDEFDRIAAATAGRVVKGELPPSHERLFALTLIDPDADPVVEAQAFRPAFGHLSLLVQIPGVDVAARVADEKGAALTARELAILDERVAAVRAWLDTYAPESARYDVVPELSSEASRLGEDQRVYLGALALQAEAAPPRSGEAWQATIFTVATDAGIPAGRAFGALYVAFLGRTNGPRAGWLLASLDHAFVLKRLRDAAGWRPAEPEAAAAGGPR